MADRFRLVPVGQWAILIWPLLALKLGMVYLVVFALVVILAVLWLIFMIGRGIFRLLSSALDFLGTQRPKKGRPSAPALSPGICVRWTPARRYEAARDLADWQIRFDAATPSPEPGSR